MKAVVQRANWAELQIDDRVHVRMGRGLVVLLGVADGDAESDADFVARKLAGLRVFEDADGKMNLGLLDLDPAGAVLVTPNFTVCGDTRKGRRPSFVGAAAPEEGNRLFERVCDLLEERGVPTARGVFGAHMHVRLENDGPVTLWIDSAKDS